MDSPCALPRDRGDVKRRRGKPPSLLARREKASPREQAEWTPAADREHREGTDAAGPLSSSLSRSRARDSSLRPRKGWPVLLLSQARKRPSVVGWGVHSGVRVPGRRNPGKMRLRGRAAVAVGGDPAAGGGEDEDPRRGKGRAGRRAGGRPLVAASRESRGVPEASPPGIPADLGQPLAPSRALLTRVSRSFSATS